jgi:hypothetical protein
VEWRQTCTREHQGPTDAGILRNTCRRIHRQAHTKHKTKHPSDALLLAGWAAHTKALRLATAGIQVLLACLPPAVVGCCWLLLDPSSRHHHCSVNVCQSSQRCCSCCCSAHGTGLCRRCCRCCCFVGCQVYLAASSKFSTRSGTSAAQHIRAQPPSASAPELCMSL